MCSSRPKFICFFASGVRKCLRSESYSIAIDADLRLKENSEPAQLNVSTKKKVAPKPPILSTAVKKKPFLPSPVKVTEIRARVNEKIQNNDQSVITAITRKTWLDEKMKTGAVA